jgi:NADPH-dependent curcumin reductase CurA
MTQEEIAQDIAQKIGTAWQAKVESNVLAKAKLSQLFAAIGTPDHMLSFVGLSGLQEALVAFSQKTQPTPEEIVYINALAEQVGDVLMFCTEKVSAEIDRRFPV